MVTSDSLFCYAVLVSNLVYTSFNRLDLEKLVHIHRCVDGGVYCIESKSRNLVHLICNSKACGSDD